MSSLTIVKTIAARPEIIFDAMIEPEGLRTVSYTHLTLPTILRV